MQELIGKTKELIQCFIETTDAFYYLYGIEALSYAYSYGRLLLKKFLGFSVALNFIIINYIQQIYSLLIALLSVSLYVLVSKRAAKDFADEVMTTYNKTVKFNEEKLKKVQITLGNCSRLLSGKIKNSNDNGLDSVISFANYYISLYSNNMISEDEIESLPLSIKNIMIIILKQRFNKNENDLPSLLKYLNKNKTKELKLNK